MNTQALLLWLPSLSLTLAVVPGCRQSTAFPLLSFLQWRRPGEQNRLLLGFSSSVGNTCFPPPPLYSHKPGDG